MEDVLNRSAYTPTRIPDREQLRAVLPIDTAGTLPSSTSRALLRSGGCIIDLQPSSARLVRRVLSGPFRPVFAKLRTADLEEVARIADEGALHVPIGPTVPLQEAVRALTALERDHTPTRSKWIRTRSRTACTDG